MLDAALALLSRPGGPVLEVFPEVIRDQAEQPLACPLPPRSDPSLPAAVDEARGLRPAWERAREAAGGTQVGRVMGPDQVPDAVAAFVRISQGCPWTDARVPGDDPASAAMDIRCYYEEAALALSGRVPEARASESWFYRRTATGAILLEALAALLRADPAFPQQFLMAPWSQQSIVPIPGPPRPADPGRGS